MKPMKADVLTRVMWIYLAKTKIKTFCKEAAPLNVPLLKYRKV